MASPNFRAKFSKPIDHERKRTTAGEPSHMALFIGLYYPLLVNSFAFGTLGVFVTSATYCSSALFYRTHSYFTGSFWGSFVLAFNGYLPAQLGVDRRNLDSLIILDNEVNLCVSIWLHKMPSLTFCVTEWLLNYAIVDFTPTFIYHIVSKYLHKNFLYTCTYVDLFSRTYV